LQSKSQAGSVIVTLDAIERKAHLSGSLQVEFMAKSVRSMDKIQLASRERLYCHAVNIEGDGHISNDGI
jgi:hypothetical protein